MATRFVDTERNAYLRDLYARSPDYRLMRVNHARVRAGRPALTLEQLPPYKPYGGRS